ncbi:hypothetical protein [Embleya sp. NBC_00896]|uniref:hypothetical protein n=1 Tax=Embleya sp. NBC_00896 TaxID=2975961 RepID=UPI002F90AFC6|nr:hypothetical protein OG928_40365 [Embleya sp. NBC_00896]
MIEYELFKARQQDTLAGAERDRMVLSVLRGRRAEAKARRAERAGLAALTTIAVFEAGDMHRQLHLLAR